jgi:hypothetical protein
MRFSTFFRSPSTVFLSEPVVTLVMSFKLPVINYNWYEEPASCPEPPDLIEPWLAYPSIATLSIVMALMTTIFAIIIASQYNSVKVFNKKVTTSNYEQRANGLHTFSFFFFCISFRNNWQSKV